MPGFSGSKNKDSPRRQAKRLREYATARGYKVYKIVEEAGSGVNDKRRKLSQLLSGKNYNKLIIVEHQDRLTRFYLIN